jgi:hypothetical protein
MGGQRRFAAELIKRLGEVEIIERRQRAPLGANCSARARQVAVAAFDYRFGRYGPSSGDYPTSLSSTRRNSFHAHFEPSTRRSRRFWRVASLTS